MINKMQMIFKFLIIISIFATNSLFANEPKLNLTPQEKEYLKNTTITYAGDPNWLPFEAFDKQGKYIGIISEHIEIIEKKLDLKFKKIITKNWSDTLELSKKTEADIISGDAADVTLAKNYKPIDIYMQNPLVIITRDNYSFVSDLNHLKDKKIAYGNGGGYSTDIVKKYPNIEFIITDTIYTGLLGVKSGKYDVFIGTLAMTDYSIVQMGIENIKIAGDTGITMNLTLFVNKNKPQLYTILNKTMKSISDIQKHNIISKWRYNKIEKVIIDYTLVWQILGISFIIVFIVLIAYQKQKKLHKKIKVLNDNLENKIKEEVEKNKQQQLLMLHQSRLAQMGEMINMIAHQWRQPLNVLSMINQTIILQYNRKKLDDEKVKYFKENTKKQIQNMSKTIDDFRNFFKPEKEKIEFYINDVISDTLELVKPILTKASIEIIFKNKQQFKIIGFPNELGQAILNIINNAKDALVENKIENKQIKIKLVEDENITLTISDNAKGIPENIIDKVFDPYFSTKENKNGTGLGLYMTKIIIEEHTNSKISVSNNKNGANFIITLNKLKIVK
ncbi:MAG: hypothetical protein DRG78_01310 [Epsilonproteobacteria bacterium]|nr:MAG: hypothetical protein DRG78_01310 [Campylobacterota bacterium]